MPIIYIGLFVICIVVFVLFWQKYMTVNRINTMKNETKVVVNETKVVENETKVVVNEKEKVKSVYDIIEYNLFLFSRGEEDAVIELAKIYMYGMHPFFLPSKMEAGQICNFIMYSDLLSKSAKYKAKQIMNDLRYDDNVINDRQYYPLPSNIIDLLSIIESNLHKYQIVIKYTTAIAQEVQVQVQEFDDILINVDDFDIETQRALFAQYAGAGAGAGDSQNVHNHTVQNIINERLKIIDTHEDNIVDENMVNFQKYIESISSDLSTEEKNNIVRVMDSFTESKHSRYDKSEKDIFNIVWNRINNPVNKQNSENMKNVFAKNLASAVEDNYVVCSTGKIARMLGSLDAMDADNNIGILKPEWAIDNEMRHIASVIRSNVIDEAEETQKAEYENGTAVGDELISKMKDLLYKKLQEEYVQTNLIDNENMEMKYSELISGF